MITDPRFYQWLEGLEARHLSDLRFSELTRALRALSARYVERRGRLLERGAFDTAGKRAAYALYYSPLHFITVTLIVKALGAARLGGVTLDLGCGAGAAGAAWASQLRPSMVVGVDANPWAIAEAALTYGAFDLAHETRRGNAARLALPRSTNTIVVGWMLNEVDEGSRDAIRTKLLQAATQVLQCSSSNPSPRGYRRGGANGGTNSAASVDAWTSGDSRWSCRRFFNASIVRLD